MRRGALPKFYVVPDDRSRPTWLPLRCESWPLVVGGFFGIRHFAAKFEDVDDEQGTVESTQAQKIK